MGTTNVVECPVFSNLTAIMYGTCQDAAQCVTRNESAYCDGGSFGFCLPENSTDLGGPPLCSTNANCTEQLIAYGDCIFSTCPGDNITEWVAAVLNGSCKSQFIVVLTNLSFYRQRNV